MLSIVATPIGNKDDLTSRAELAIRNCHYIIAESIKNGRYWQKKYNQDATLLLLNEHSSPADKKEITAICLSESNCVLVCDGGTPLFEDPGVDLVGKILMQNNGIANLNVLDSLPGPSSLMLALSLCPFPMHQFHFAGFLNREPTIRRQEITSYLKYGVPLIIMDTAYRLKQLLADLALCFSPQAKILLCLELTTSEQKIYWQTPKQILAQIQNDPTKRQFIIITNT